MAAILLISIVQKNFKLPTPPQSLGVRFSECEQKCNISIGHYKKIEKWLPKISNYQPSPKILGLQFSEYQRKWNISVGHYEKIEK